MILQGNMKSIVVDADVACSASENDNPEAKHCRDTLNAISDKENKYKIAFCEKLIIEWNKHRSAFTSKWFVEMVDKHRIVKFEDIDVKLDALRDHIRNTQEERIAEIVLNDVHLVETALKVDKIIISNDKRSFRPFCKISKTYTQIKDLLWVIPNKKNTDCSKWLIDGAKPEDRFKLGYLKLRK